MELLKLYRGNDGHHLALHRNDEGQLLMTLSYKDVFKRRHPHKKAPAWLILDHFEFELRRRPELELKPVPLLVSQYEGRKRFFETASDLAEHYSSLGIDTTGLVDMLDRDVPVIFGKLTVRREQAWHFNEGHAGKLYGRQSVM